MPGIRRPSEATEIYSERPLKRVRLSVEASSSDDEDNNQTPPDGNRSASASFAQLATQEQFQSLRDEASDDEADKKKERRARKFLEKENEKYAGNEPRPYGIIESVECQNFMCHTHLEISLGPLINFIVGHNGSGKSAVLTAITLCLGGKATSTNRGQNLKSFVKEGKENCVLKVKIKNTSSAAFRHDLYGDAIIVERHFSVHGNSSFKIKAENGRVISTKRQELDEITDYMGLQLDNPVNVLTQDNARQFLNNSTSAQKYSFFLKGVQLEQLTQDYNLLYEEIWKIDQCLPQVKESCSELERRLDVAQKKHQRTKDQDNLRDEHRQISHQCAWAQVEEQERMVEKAQDDIAEAQAKIDTYQKEEEKYSERYDRLHQAHEDAKAAEEQVQDARAPLEAARDTAKQQFDAKRNEMLQFQSDQRALKSEVVQAETRRRNLNKAYNDELRRIEALNDGSHAKLVQELEQARTEHEEARKQLDLHPGKKGPLEMARNTAEYKANEGKRAVNDKQKEYEAAVTRLRTLEHGKQNQQNAYHSSLRQLQNMIQRETRWRKKPVGPLGMHVTLKQPKWSPLLERYIGGTLNNFVVSCKADEMLLSDMVRRSGYRCSVFIGNDSHIDTSRHESDLSLTTIMRVLSFSHEAVRNQLIINQNIERVLLIEDRNDMFDYVNANKDFQGSIICFDDNSRAKGQLMNVNARSRKLDPINGSHTAARMTTDNAAQVDIQKSIVAAARPELGSLQTQATEADNHLHRCRQAVNAHGRELNALKAREQELEEKLDAAQQALDVAQNDDSPLETYKQDEETAQEEEAQYRLQYEESKRAFEELGVQNKEHKKALDRAQKVLDDHSKTIGAAEAATAKARHKREQTLRQKNEAIATTTREKERKEGLDRAAEKEANTLQDYHGQASDYAERVPVPAGVSSKQLEDKANRLRKQIEQAEREVGGSAEEIHRAFIKAKRDHQPAEVRYRHLDEQLGTLKASINERVIRWRRFRSEISARARIQFEYLLAERGFHGKLRFRHRDSELDLTVQPDPTQHSAGAEGRQTKTLSGGEKSFSTICLLLALWDAMGSPIRCLDEFDVFMDSVNREQSMKMMVQAARRSVGRQFILISPQSMGHFNNNAPDIKVHLMHEPERGQTSLPFGQSQA